MVNWVNAPIDRYFRIARTLVSFFLYFLLSACSPLISYGKLIPWFLHLASWIQVSSLLFCFCGYGAFIHSNNYFRIYLIFHTKLSLLRYYSLYLLVFFWYFKIKLKYFIKAILIASKDGCTISSQKSPANFQYLFLIVLRFLVPGTHSIFFTMENTLYNRWKFWASFDVWPYL